MRSGKRAASLMSVSRARALGAPETLSPLAEFVRAGPGEWVGASWPGRPLSSTNLFNWMLAVDEFYQKLSSYRPLSQPCGLVAQIPPQC